MALKTKDLRAMNAQDRAKALTENRAELMHQRGLAAMGGAMKNPGLIRDLRTSIARILTIETQRKDADLGSRPAPKAARTPGAKPAAAKPAAKPAAKGAAKGGAPKATGKKSGGS